jgi:hypothetical protein
MMQETLKNMAKILESLPKSEEIKALCEQQLILNSQIKTEELTKEQRMKLDDSQKSILDSLEQMEKLKNNLNGHNI